MVGSRGRLISEQLAARRDDQLTVVARLPEPELSAQADTAQTLQTNAAETQQAVTAFADEREGVRVRNRFWITNAVVLDVDTTKISLDEIARVPEVERLHENFEVEALDGERSEPSAGSTDSAALSHGEHTYGLEQIDAPAVWNQFGTQGTGATVAVLDTGIDPDHPDIDLSKWAEFDGSGNQVESDPYDSGSHGTHVSGTVSGGDASGEHIGVAPNVELYHGGVLTDAGGNFAAIIGGIQWAVDQNVDVINMSLGTPNGGFLADVIEPLQNAKAAGTLAVCSSGNSSEGTTGSPGNVYDASIAIGAADSNDDITSFSSGEKVVTEEDWGSDAPDDWPAEYIVPDVAGPGASVKSSVPGDDYGTKSGTSMSSPHVAGVAGLMVAASGGAVTPDEIWDALESTAWKPDDWDESNANAVIDGKDTRYGEGIVDALSAVQQVALDTGVTGVVKSEGAAFEGATVELNGLTVTTDETGSFELLAEPGTYNLTISGPGIETTTQSVTVEDSGSLTDLGTLTVDSVVELQVVAGQTSDIEGGESVSLTLEAYNLDTLQVSLSGSYAESDASLTVDGGSVGFGEEVSFDDYTGQVSVTVGTTPDTSGEFGLDHVASGAGTQTTVSTGPTTVFERLVSIGVIDADDRYGEGIATTLSDNLAGIFSVSTTTTSDVANNPGAYDGVVVQKLDGGAVADFVGTTDQNSVGVVYLDQWGTESDGITQYASESSSVSNTDQNYNDGDPAYEPTGTHPILDGVSTQGQVLLHTGDDQDHTWFEADGQFNALATVAAVTNVKGTGLAIDEGTQTVLAATLGRSQYVNESEFTEGANTLLTNAVAYVSTDPKEGAMALSAAGTTGVQRGGLGTVQVDAVNAARIAVEDVWVDWGIDGMSTDGATFDGGALRDTGTCEFEWGGPRGSCTPSIRFSLPDRYAGGEYRLTIKGYRGQETVETTATISVF